MNPKEIILATSTLLTSVEASLAKAKVSFNSDPHAWIEKEISQHLGPSIGYYATYFQTLAVNDIDHAGD